MSCPDQAILGKNLTFTLQSFDTSGSPVDTDSLPTYSIYEDETATAIATGTMAKLDDSGTTGFYSEQIAVTSANGFEIWKSYTIRYSAAISGTSVSSVDTFNVVQTALSATTTTGALTTVANFKTYAGITTDDDDALLTSLIARATDAIEKYCRRTLRSTTYRELYDGRGDTKLLLNEYPVTAITLVATGRIDVVRLTNSNSDAYNAYAQVDATNLELTVNGGANDGTDTLTLSSYSTITSLVSAINSLGTGWSATNLLSSYEDWSATELIPCQAISAFDSTYGYLELPEQVENDFRIEMGQAEIYLPTGFPVGYQNVLVRYTAGYATTPSDLEQICIDLVNIYYRSRERSTDVKRERLGDHDIWFADNGGGGARDIPESLQTRLAPYRRYTMGYI